MMSEGESQSVVGDREKQQKEESLTIMSEGKNESITGDREKKHEVSSKMESDGKNKPIVEDPQKQQMENEAKDSEGDSQTVIGDTEKKREENDVMNPEGEDQVGIVGDYQQRENGALKPEAVDQMAMRELESKLQDQLRQAAEAEERARVAESNLEDLRALCNDQFNEIEKFRGLEEELQVQVNAREDAENNSRISYERIENLEADNREKSAIIANLEKDFADFRKQVEAREQELESIRAQRDEQERKEMALTSRLNVAKKKEAEKASIAENYEEEIRAVESDLREAKKQIDSLKSDRDALQERLKTVEEVSGQRVRLAELSLSEERKLNEERKRKMKAFVENKSEEITQCKAENASLQDELSHANRSLMDLNNRWKQLHAQWVQSQTRNRELQRDLNRQKKDSENLHKVGDTLGMKLSRSANETEEHKNKRLAAKHELMTVLRTLEAEREVSSKLRDSLKFTFTPKALSQQQLLKESLDEFEAQLVKLSRRLGKPLPPTSDHSDRIGDGSEVSEESYAAGANGDRQNKSDTETQRLISKLEFETQRVSQCIMAFTGGIERMHLVLNASGERTCYTVLSEIISSGGVSTANRAANSREETAAMTGERPRRLVSIRSHDYGQVPSASL